MSPAIGLSRVCKSYRMHRRTAGAAHWWQALSGRGTAQRRTVLDAIDLEIAHGESLAILGRNGAGKSTLLKIIAGVALPDSGHVQVQGRIGPLIELGAGFHPEETARANVRSAAALMGAEPRRLDALLDEVLAFAQLEAHADKPLKHFSSGMVVRLGFAVIAAVRPPILLSDEVLAVGDESFQKRCIRWLESYREAGNTLILVSHNLYQVQKLCRRAVWLEGGRIREDGGVFPVCQAYRAFHEARARGVEGAASSDKPPLARGLALAEPGDGPARRLRGELAAAAELRLVRMDGTVLASTRLAGPGRFEQKIALQDLLPGQYALELVDPARRLRSSRLPLPVAGESREFGSCRLDVRWS